MTKTGWIIILVVIAVAAGLYIWQKANTPNITESAELVSEALPEIPSSPIEDKVPELNPVDKANPFKYENPLR